MLCDGKVFSCGWSADGQTGRGVYHNLESFGRVQGDLKSEKVIKLSCKADCVLALTGNIYSSAVMYIYSFVSNMY